MKTRATTQVSSSLPSPISRSMNQTAQLTYTHISPRQTPMDPNEIFERTGAAAYTLQSSPSTSAAPDSCSSSAYSILVAVPARDRSISKGSGYAYVASRTETGGRGRKRSRQGANDGGEGKTPPPFLHPGESPGPPPLLQAITQNLSSALFSRPPRSDSPLLRVPLLPPPVSSSLAEEPYCSSAGCCEGEGGGR